MTWINGPTERRTDRVVGGCGDWTAEMRMNSDDTSLWRLGCWWRWRCSCDTATLISTTPPCSSLPRVSDAECCGVECSSLFHNSQQKIAKAKHNIHLYLLIMVAENRRIICQLIQINIQVYEVNSHQKICEHLTHIYMPITRTSAAQSYVFSHYLHFLYPRCCLHFAHQEISCHIYWHLNIYFTISRLQKENINNNK